MGDWAYAATQWDLGTVALLWSVLLGPLPLLVALIYAVRHRQTALFLQSLYFLRFQYSLALFLAGFPILALGFAPLLLKSLLVLSGRQVLVVTYLGILAAWVVMVTTMLASAYAQKRFVTPVQRPRDWLTDWQIPAFALLAAPIVTAALMVSPAPHRGRLLGVGIAVVLAALTLPVMNNVRALLFPAWATGDPRFATSRYVLRRFREFDLWKGLKIEAVTNAIGQWIRLLFEWLGPGYVDDDKNILEGHLSAIAFLVVAGAVYVAGYFYADPPHPAVPSITAVAYVLLLAILGGWWLCGVAFFLDRFRVPVLGLLAALSFVIVTVTDTDHYFHLFRAPAEPQGAPTTSATAVEAWLRSQASARPVMTVVAAEGGGILAAAWTAQVLTGLEEEIPGFWRSIRLISSVSGGSVGALYFMDALTRHGLPPGAGETIRKAAAASSLSATAWGLVYPDLIRAFWPLGGVDKHLDRAWAMERQWQRQLRHPSARLSEWRDGVATGWRPIAIFNSTIAETGERLLFAPIDVSLSDRAQTLKMYGGYDIAAVTAARLSATFPYVTPMARADIETDDHRSRHHIADGGYYDNYGVFTLIEWLDPILTRYGSQLGRVLILEIRAGPPGRYRQPPARRGWVYEFLGPLVATFQVRTSTQAERNDFAIAQFRRRWPRPPIESVVLAPSATGPLSWHLTEADKETLRREWESFRRRPEMERIRSALR